MGSAALPPPADVQVHVSASDAHVLGPGLSDDGATSVPISSISAALHFNGVEPPHNDHRQEQDYVQLLAAAVGAANLSRMSHQIRLPPSELMRKLELEVGPKALDPLQDGDFTTVEVGRLHKATHKAERRMLVDATFATSEQDNLYLLTRFRQRMDKVGIHQPAVEVRFEDVRVEARVDVGERGMPTILNAYRNVVEGALTAAHLMRSDRRPFNILQGVSGVLKPGRLTLLLGPPGSGKSTLLKVLAGVVRQGSPAASSLRLEGTVRYNGETFDTFQVRRTAAYIDQVDNLLAELTVRETLDFAAACQGSGYTPALIAELRAREKAAGVVPEPEVDAMLKAIALPGGRHNVSSDIMLRILGIDICAQTQVGNSLMRGISGGQKKRVTTGELIVGPHKTLFMDEISTGLDSSTTFLITQCMRNFVHLMDGTVLMALLQPPPEVFELFDDVMLLSEGHIVYHGPREQVAPFFSLLGFEVPERKGTCDFLQEVTSNKDQGQYWSGKEAHEFKPVLELCAAFEKSAMGLANAAELAHPYQPHKEQILDPLIRTKFAMTAYQGFRVCLWREITIMKRNVFLYAFKTIHTMLLAFIISTLFVKPRQHPGTTVDNGTKYLAIIFFSLIHLMFTGYAEMAVLCSQLPVFYKQRDMQFFPAWCFALPSVFLRVFWSMWDGFVWSVMVYWSTGFAPQPGRFFIFFVYMCLIHQMALTLFRFMSAIGRSFAMANNLGSVALALIILLGGFVMVKGDIHPWWIWFFWLCPLMYPTQALAINEFTSQRWSTPTVYDGEVMTLGQAILASRSLFAEQYYVWLGVIVLLGYIVVFNLGTFFCLTHLNAFEGAQAMMSEEALAEREFNRTGVDPDSAATPATTPAAAAPAQAGASHSAVTIVPPPSAGAAASRAASRMSAERTRSDILSAASATGPRAIALSNRKSAERARSDVLAAASATGPRAVARKSAERARSDILAAASATASVNLDLEAALSGTSAASGKGMMLPFVPMAMAFRNMCYQVDMPDGMDGYAEAKAAGESTPQLVLLHHMTGTFRPGVLTALMGVSGAGKTTLMDVLAGRKTSGVITGDVHVAGFVKDQSTFSRVCGYVEQTDIHSPRTTVREALAFSGLLRLYGVTRAVVEAFVDEVLQLVELEPLRNALVGMPGVFGLSVEQRKRLTIAVELVANPSVIFMDEPTSGLDARAAAIVMRAVRNTVNTGRTVVCTIHQPSIDIFEAFDDLLLLKRGGHIIYNGPIGIRSDLLIAYFSAIKGVTPIRDKVNPVTWALEVSSMGAEARTGLNFADVYRDSDLATRNDEQAQLLAVPKPGATALYFEHATARGFGTQLLELQRRDQRQYWRDPGYNAVRFAFSTVLGLILGSLYWDLGQRYGTPTDVYNIMGALFVCINFLGTANTSGIMPVVSTQRPIFYREQATFMYGITPYFLSQGLVELPYIVVQTCLYSSITYWMIGFQADVAKFFWYLLFNFLTLVLYSFYGMAAIACTPIMEIANIMNVLWYSIWFLFGGFIMAYQAMPAWWSWYYWLDPLAYTLYGIITSQLGDVTAIVTNDDGSLTTVSEYLTSTLGFKHTFIGWCAFIMIAFALVFWAVVGIALRVLNFNKR